MSYPPLKRVVDSTEYCSENRDKTETLLAFGASRFEACRPLAIESLRLALMPTINQMR
jgi:ABC-type iron transport system FetAB permease component